MHVLMGLKATHCLSNILRDMKRSSSEWMQITAGVRSFAWLEGYGAFTVSASLREAVHKYIHNQEEHHRRRTFREEYLEFLRRHGVAFEERYVD